MRFESYKGARTRWSHGKLIRHWKEAKESLIKIVDDEGNLRYYYFSHAPLGLTGAFTFIKGSSGQNFEGRYARAFCGTYSTLSLPF